MVKETAFENGRISKFKGFMTLTLILDQVIPHTVMHHSSTSAYTPNFIKIEETFCGRTDRTDVRSYARTDGHLGVGPALLCRLCRRVDLKHTTGFSRPMSAFRNEGQDLSLLFPSTTTFTQMILRSSSLFTHSTSTQAFLTFKTLCNTSLPG